ncbi:MAG: autotransporter-associated beta strand repeat-containing protein [bacterium]
MKLRKVLLGAALTICAAAGRAEPAKVDDPAGVLKKPIPDRLVVLTFDDGCASGYTVVAPILKALGFNGTFYVCDFDSFKTRKDWYMTWRQMIGLDRQGFEIGNHTVGHGGGLDNYLAMEDELFANNGPKMTTVCWPLYGVVWKICPDLAKHGYLFGRGGHERPYRPTVDHPFDVSSFTITERLPLEAFVKQAQQACQGRVVVYCFHGVPDMEHSSVGVEPATFKVMMQYLKDNNYTCIAMRDLADYIDPVKAAKLPPTANEVKAEDPFLTNKDDKPCGVLVKAAKANPAPEKKATVNKNMLTTNAPFVKAISADKQNVFSWKKAEAGNWSDGSKWSNNLSNGSAPVAAGQPDYVLNFNQAGKYDVTQDMEEGFRINQLNLRVGQGNALMLTGKGLTFTGTQPSINQNSIFTEDRINLPISLASDVTVNSFGFNYSRPSARLIIGGLISGPGGLIVNDGGPLHIINSSNTYSGGTVINGGTLAMDGWSNGQPGTLGTGPVTLNEGATLTPCGGVCTNALILNGGTIEGNFTWNGPITLNGITEIDGYNLNLNNKSGGISGPGGLTEIGIQGAFGRINFGTVYLWGVNTYTGPTTVHQAKLFVKKAAALYNADTAQWIPAKISVHPAATLVISAGGPGEFTGEQTGILLKNLTASVNSNGLMAGSALCLDTVNANEPVTVSANIPDSKGPGGGAFLLKKCGAGTLQLSGKNTYTGQTILESGALSVTSLNSFTKGKAKACGSLGAPLDIEAGEIVIGEEGKAGECALIYTGAGEISDRVMNFAGKKAAVTFDQSGTGLLKLTSTFVISGYGADKTLVLTGSTAGTGEIAGNIFNPYDRAGKAVISVTKSGTGTWVLSGTNTYTGPTTVKQGTLSIASVQSLGDKTDVYLSEGARLELNFKGERRIAKLYLDGKVQPEGTCSAENAPQFVKGKGVLKNQ